MGTPVPVGVLFFAVAQIVVPEVERGEPEEVHTGSAAAATSVFSATEEISAPILHTGSGVRVGVFSTFNNG